MKIGVLPENNPLRVTKVVQISEMSEGTICMDRVQMRIFTDGEIDQETETKTYDINEFYMGKKPVDFPVDALKVKDVTFKNHSYVVVFTIVKRHGRVGNVAGFFNYLDDVKVYLANPKDKKALREAKKVIARIEDHNNSVDYSSVFSMLLGEKKGLVEFEPHEVVDNVYQVSRVSK